MGREGGELLKDFLVCEGLKVPQIQKTHLSPRDAH